MLPHQMTLRTKAPPQTRQTYICEAGVSFTHQHHNSQSLDNRIIVHLRVGKDSKLEVSKCESKI